MFVVYVLVVYAWWRSWFLFCHHASVDGVGVGCGHYELILVMHLLCMLASIHHYAYIDMIIVVVHEIMVCGWYGHALIT